MAAPVFSRITAGALRMLNVVPDAQGTLAQRDRAVREVKRDGPASRAGPRGAAVPPAAGHRRHRGAAGLRHAARQSPAAAGDLFIACPASNTTAAIICRGSGRRCLRGAGRGGSQRRTAAAAGQLPVVEVSGLAEQLGLIAARFYGHPSARMTVVGITGTNGKTTTSRVLAQLLRVHTGHCGVIGTLGATLGDDVTVARRIPRPMPSACTVNWRTGAAEGVAAAVLEVSSHSLVQGRVGGLDFDTAIFTNLTHDHLDYHGDMEDYAAAKARLFAVDGLRHAVINSDDDYAVMIAAAVASEVEIIDYAIEDSNAAVVPVTLLITMVVSKRPFILPGVMACCTAPWPVISTSPTCWRRSAPPACNGMPLDKGTGDHSAARGRRRSHAVRRQRA